MANAAIPAAGAGILQRHKSLELVSGPYHFEISAAAGGSVYSVNDGTHSISQPLQWAFGTGEVGQTYVYQNAGVFYESRVSFYPVLQGLDLTLGHHPPAAADLGDALGRAMVVSETRLCFGCHTTRSTTSGQFDVNSLIPGISCEACHGPGAKHVAAMRHKQTKPGLPTILNPARLDPSDSVDFCGACHRTAWDVALSNAVGVARVRFQPYRLEKSRCWGKGDARLTCLACHDPHRPLVRDPAAYDNQCLSCHGAKAGVEAGATSRQGGGVSSRVCPAGTSKCVTCHMAKYEIPGSHAQFTDHWIRVVKGEVAYPE
jgi:hypothetical protein